MVPNVRADIGRTVSQRYAADNSAATRQPALGRLALLPKEALQKTGPLDEGDWNYRPLLNIVSRSRFRLVLALLGSGRVETLLEVGYGSGIFASELARRSVRYYGIDVHGHAAAVARTLASHGTVADLSVGSIERTDYADASFDRIVSVSALEFAGNMDAACREMRRILRPDGALIVVAPRESKLLDLLLFCTTGRRADGSYVQARRRLVPTLLRYFTLDAERCYPQRGPVAIYRGLRLRRNP